MITKNQRDTLEEVRKIINEVGITKMVCINAEHPYEVISNMHAGVAMLIMYNKLKIVKEERQICLN